MILANYQMFLIAILFVVSEKNVLQCYAHNPLSSVSNENATTDFSLKSKAADELCSHQTYLEIGVCKMNGYKTYVLPSRNLTIFVSMKNQNVHSVNDKTSTLSVDAELILYWIDPGIMASFDEDSEALGYIPLSSKAIDKIWTPDIYVYNLSDYKNFMDSQHVSSVKVMHNNSYFQTDETIIEYKIEFRAPVYCKFDFTNYPKDKTSCRFLFGSQYSNIQYIFVDENLVNNHSVTGLHLCKMSMTNTSLLTSKDFKNSIGLDIEIERTLRPFIYRYFLPSAGSVLVSSLSMTLPTNALQARVGISVTLLLITVNLYVTQMDEIPPQIEFIDSCSLLLLATLGFVTLTLIETSSIVLIGRIQEFRKYKRSEEKEEPYKGYQPPIEEMNDSNENELHTQELPSPKTNYKQKCTRIDIICFIVFILIYSLFITVYLYLLL